MAPRRDLGGNGPRRRAEDARWVPPGGLVNLHGFDIPGGMTYVGRFQSASPGGGWAHDKPAPGLIDPSLPVAKRKPSSPPELPNVPEYHELGLQQRVTYLGWLADGKREASYPVGYALLYFYGLERRLLVDAPGPDEERLLVAEVERLRAMHASDGRIEYHAKRLVEVVELRRMSGGPNGIADWKPELGAIRRSGLAPLGLQLLVSLHTAARMPLGCDLALAAMLAYPPSSGGPHATTPMSRARPEFVALVRKRFARVFPDGFRPARGNGLPLYLYHSAAAQGLEVELKVEGPRDLPDPAGLRWEPLAELCTKAAEDLAPYAKVIGKDRAKAGTAAATMLLPPDLAGTGEAPEFGNWLRGLPGPVAEVPVAELARRCFGEDTGPVGSRAAAEMSAILASAGYGMEPDPAYGGDRPDGHVLLFPLGAAGTHMPAPSTSFLKGCAAAAGLAPADPGEDAVLALGLVASCVLGVEERVRLLARYRAMRGRQLTAARLRTLVAAVPEGERGAVAELAASLAARSGETSPALVGAVERLWQACGRDTRSLYAMMHQGAAASAAPAQEPVVVEAADKVARGFRIPPPPAAKPSPPRAVDLAIDMARVAAIQRETRELEQALARVYEEEPEDAPEPVSAPAPAGARFPGLRADHAGLLDVLCARTEWARGEFERLVRERGLMPDGAIETINEWGLDALDADVIEDGDPLKVNVALLPVAQEAVA